LIRTRFSSFVFKCLYFNSTTGCIIFSLYKFIYIYILYLNDIIGLNVYWPPSTSVSSQPFIDVQTFSQAIGVIPCKRNESLQCCYLRLFNYFRNQIINVNICFRSKFSHMISSTLLFFFSIILWSSVFFYFTLYFCPIFWSTLSLNSLINMFTYNVASTN